MSDYTPDPSRLYQGDEVQALLNQARLDEITRFAHHAEHQKMRTIAQIQAYFMARTVMLAMGLGGERPVPENTPPSTLDDYLERADMPQDGNGPDPEDM